MKNTLLILTFAALLAACGTSNTSSLDACACAKATVQGNVAEETAKQCDASRKADAGFEADYQKCLLAARAGVDSSQISINKMDAEKGLDLPSAGDGVYSFLAPESSVKWVGTKVTGKHNGGIKVKGGTLEMAAGNITKGEIIIDMTSLSVEDLTGDQKSDLEAHLNSDDFFSTSKHKEAKFTFASAKATNKHQYEVSGDLTIKGITKPITANILVIPVGDKTVKINGGFSVDRTNYDIKFRSGKFFSDLGDKMIYDEFVITLDLKASK